MKFELTIVNGYVFEIQFREPKNKPIPPGATVSYTVDSDGIMEVPGMGEIVILDVSKQNVSDFPIHGENGVLIRYKSTEGYYRFDNDGELKMEFSFAGDFVLSAGSGELIEVKLPEAEVIPRMEHVTA